MPPPERQAAGSSPPRWIPSLLLTGLALTGCQGGASVPGDGTAGPASGSAKAAAPAQALFHEDFERDDPDAGPTGWQAVSLGEAAPTRWTVLDQSGDRVLQGLAEDAASGLARPVEGPAGTLRWRWRVEALADGPGDERTRQGDDFAARVLVTFASRPGAGLADALQDTAARLAGHDQVPAAALAYVVARDLPAGTHFESPYTERVHTFVVRGTGDDRDAWRTEQRDLAADFLVAFGGPAPAVTGIQLLTDTDDAGGRACALYDDLMLLPPGDG